jgi:hypothetical protein
MHGDCGIDAEEPQSSAENWSRLPHNWIHHLSCKLGTVYGSATEVLFITLLWLAEKSGYGAKTPRQ